MRQYVARPGQECKSELIIGAGLEHVRWTAWYYQFWWWCNETRVAIKEKTVLEMPSENRQCQGRRNMGGQLIPDTRCSGWKRFWSGHWCFPQWCRYIEEEDRSDCEGVYLGRIWARYKGCWWCSTLKAVVAILKLILWRTGSQCRPARVNICMIWFHPSRCYCTEWNYSWTFQRYGWKFLSCRHFYRFTKKHLIALTTLFLSAPLRSNGADYVLLLFIFILFFFIHPSFSETTRPIFTKFSGIVYSGVVE